MQSNTIQTTEYTLFSMKERVAKYMSNVKIPYARPTIAFMIEKIGALHLKKLSFIIFLETSGGNNVANKL